MNCGSFSGSTAFIILPEFAGLKRLAGLGDFSMYRLVPTAVGVIALAWASVAKAGETVDPLGSDLWNDLKEAYLGDAPVVYDDAVRLIMPLRVEDAHSVPVVVKLSQDLGEVAELTVIAENNPIQAAAQIFPRRPMHAVGMNIRLEQSTPVRAAALDASGVWHVSSLAVTVMSPGGCSTAGDAMADNALGQIVLKQFDRAGGASRLKVKINHPMDTGFAPDDSGELVPAYYIEKVTVEDEAGPVADLITWAALASDPSFFFDLPDAQQSVRVQASDTKGLAFEAMDPAPSM